MLPPVVVPPVVVPPVVVPPVVVLLDVPQVVIMTAITSEKAPTRRPSGLGEGA